MRGLRTAVNWGVLAVLAGCGYENPGFQLKGSDDGAGASETGVSVSGASEASVSGVPTTGEPPDPTTGPGTSVSTTTGLPDTNSGEVGSAGTTGEPLTNVCDAPAKVELTIVKDTFLVDRSWPDGAACSLLEEVAPEGNWMQGTTYCRDRNFGVVAALPLVDAPVMGGRDAIHYLVRFDMAPLLDVSTQQPVQFAQIQGADLWLMVKRLGLGVKVGAYALHADQGWDVGYQSGEPAVEYEATYRCRVAPAPMDPVKACIAAWTHTVPIPEGGSPMREEATDALPKDEAALLKIPFKASDFKDGLEGFFSEAEHNGFFIGLRTVDLGSTADKLKVYADEAAETDEGDIKLVVHYCPALP